MNFLWPSALFALLLIPLLILLYFWNQRRKRRFAIRYSSLSLVRAALPAQSRLRRYLPMALFFLAFASLVVALARPVRVTRVPAGRATVMLALDVSRSMEQRDIAPSRFSAAKSAALSFINKQKETNQVGIVAFAGIAQLVQAPSTDPEALETAIHSLTTGRGTAIGEGIAAALKTIAEYNQNVAARIDEQGTDTPVPATGAAAYEPDIIVLLTDGNNNRGIDPFSAAQQAADSRVRVYTISFGTAAGSGDQRGWGYGGNRGIDEATLQKIASLTGGEYFTASSAAELQKVFNSLPTELITREETLEISVAFVAIASLMVIGAVLLSQLWHPLP
jgi:Ca-activated chloride channel family protein